MADHSPSIEQRKHDLSSSFTLIQTLEEIDEQIGKPPNNAEGTDTSNVCPDDRLSVSFYSYHCQILPFLIFNRKGRLFC